MSYVAAASKKKGSGKDTHPSQNSPPHPASSFPNAHAKGKPQVRTDGPSQPGPGAPVAARPTSPTHASNMSTDVNRQMFDRLLFVTANLIGRYVSVLTKNGITYKGIFNTASPDKGYGVALKMASRVPPPPIAEAPIPMLVIHPKDFVQLVALDVSLEESLSDHHGRSGGFHTDTDISGHDGELRERELQPWNPDDEESSHYNSGSRNRDEDTFGSSHDGRGWDQFAANERMFGVKTSWDEEIYTTAIDRSAPAFADREREAQRIAHEIESKGADNTHLAEERGHAIDAGNEDMDEEDKYSSVIRKAPSYAHQQQQDASGPGKYVPPNKRGSTSGANKKDLVVQTGSVPALASSSGSVSPASDLASASPLGSSSEEILPRSPRSPILSMSPRGQDPATLERLRLRKAIVGETFRNTAPVPGKRPDDFPQSTTSPRSPLLSPMVNDPSTINALTLEPVNPSVPAEVVEEFMSFRREAQAAKQSDQRDRTLKDLKTFSTTLNISNVSGRPRSGSRPSSPLVSPSTSSSSLQPPPPSSSSTSSATTTPATTTATTASSPTTTSSPSTVVSSTVSFGSIKLSRLNPNAKSFTPGAPMSAGSAEFVPKGGAMGPAGVAKPPPNQQGPAFGGPPMLPPGAILPPGAMMMMPPPGAVPVMPMDGYMMPPGPMGHMMFPGMPFAAPPGFGPPSSSVSGNFKPDLSVSVRDLYCSGWGKRMASGTAESPLDVSPMWPQGLAGLSFRNPQSDDADFFGQRPPHMPPPMMAMPYPAPPGYPMQPGMPGQVFVPPGGRAPYAVMAPPYGAPYQPGYTFPPGMPPPYMGGPAPHPGGPSPVPVPVPIPAGAPGTHNIAPPASSPTMSPLSNSPQQPGMYMGGGGGGGGGRGKGGPMMGGGDRGPHHHHHHAGRGYPQQQGYAGGGGRGQDDHKK